MYAIHGHVRANLLAASLLVIAAGCTPSREPDPQPSNAAAVEAAAPAAPIPSAQPAPESSAQPQALSMVVHKSASCGCCGAWVDHMRHAGFRVEVRDADDLEPVKTRLGIPYGKGSCHTAEVGGYFVEGHVPATDVRRLLAEKPDAKGLVLSGMPAGSPGMELPDGRTEPYTVELVQRDGTTQPFAAH
jgi:hypothetical protein